MTYGNIHSYSKFTGKRTNSSDYGDDEYARKLSEDFPDEIVQLEPTDGQPIRGFVAGKEIPEYQYVLDAEDEKKRSQYIRGQVSKITEIKYKPDFCLWDAAGSRSKFIREIRPTFGNPLSKFSMSESLDKARELSLVYSSQRVSVDLDPLNVTVFYENGQSMSVIDELGHGGVVHNYWPGFAAFVR